MAFSFADMGLFVYQTLLYETFTEPYFHCDIDKVHTACLAYERHCAAGSRVDFDYIQPAVFLGKLDVHHASYIELSCDPECPLFHLFKYFGFALVRREHCGRVTGVDTGSLDVLQDTADVHTLSVAYSIKIVLECILKELVNQYGRFSAYCYVGSLEELPEAVFIVCDEHAPSSQNEGGAQKNREAYLPCLCEYFIFTDGTSVLGLSQAESFHKSGEESAVFGLVNSFQAGSYDVGTPFLELCRHVERCLPAQLKHDVPAVFLFHDFNDFFCRERAYVKSVGSVEVSGDRLRV